MEKKMETSVWVHLIISRRCCLPDACQLAGFELLQGGKVNTISKGGPHGFRMFLGNGKA